MTVRPILCAELEDQLRRFLERLEDSAQSRALSHLPNEGQATSRNSCCCNQASPCYSQQACKSRIAHWLLGDASLPHRNSTLCYLGDLVNAKRFAWMITLIQR